MTLPVLIGLGAALGFLALRWTAEYYFHLVFGYIGAGVVRLLTMGRIRMDPHHATEANWPAVWAWYSPWWSRRASVWFFRRDSKPFFFLHLIWEN